MALRQRPEWSGPPTFPRRGVCSQLRGPVSSCAPEGGLSGCRGGRTERSSRRLYLFIYWFIYFVLIYSFASLPFLSFVFFPLAKELLNSTVSSPPCVSCACFKCERIRCGFGVRRRKRASGRTTRTVRTLSRRFSCTLVKCVVLHVTVRFLLWETQTKKTNCLRHRRAYFTEFIHARDYTL